VNIKVIQVGRSAPEAERLLKKELALLGDIEIKFLSDSGLRVIVGYEEKTSSKPLTKKPSGDKIKVIKNKSPKPKRSK